MNGSSAISRNDAALLILFNERTSAHQRWIIGEMGRLSLLILRINHATKFCWMQSVKNADGLGLKLIVLTSFFADLAVFAHYMQY